MNICNHQNKNIGELSRGFRAYILAFLKSLSQTTNQLTMDFSPGFPARPVRREYFLSFAFAKSSIKKSASSTFNRSFIRWAVNLRKSL